MAELSNLKSAQLVATYRSAEADIMTKLNQALLKGNNTQYLVGQLQSIKGILSQLEVDGKAWVGQTVPLIYQQGIKRAEDQLDAAGLSTASLGPAFGAINQQTVQILTDNTNERLGSLANFIGRNMDDVYRNLALESIRGSAIGYDTWKQAAKQYKSNLADKGVTGFKDKAGRNWNMNSYVKMVARTTTMEAHLQGTKNRLLQSGHDLVIVSTHSNSCKQCIPWQGKVLSLTGRTPEYQTLDYARSQGLFHPNCEHAYSLSIDLEDDIIPPSNDPLDSLTKSSGIDDSRSWMDNSAIPNNLLTGSDRKQYFLDSGYTLDQYNEMQDILNSYGLGGAHQTKAQGLMAKALKDDTPLGKILREQSRLEEGLHEHWEMFGTKVTNINKRIYRKGGLGKDFESWSTSEEGADMGGGGIGYDHMMTYSDLKERGYSLLGGGSKMMGAPGEGELTFIRSSLLHLDSGGASKLSPLSGSMTYNTKSKAVLKDLKGKMDVKSKLETAQNTKKRISQELANRLEGNADFESLMSQIQPGFFKDGKHLFPESLVADREDVCSQLIQNWAGDSAGDSLGVAMQMNANKMFKLGNSTYTGYGDLLGEATTEWGKHDKGIQAFLQAQYDNTQRYFKDQGITHVPALRGAGWKRGEAPPGVNFDGTTQKLPFQLQPLSSFSLDAKTAERFSFSGASEERMMVGSDIPVDRIFSTCQTGFGCKNEAELVVIGGTDDMMAVSYDVKIFLKQGSDAVPTGNGLFKAMADAGKVAKK